MENGSNDNYYDEYEIDLREYIILLWNHKLFIGAFVILAVIAAFIVSSFLLSPTYETEASFYATDFQLANNTLEKTDYLSLFKRTKIMEELINDYSLDEGRDTYSVENLSKKLTISTNENNVVNLTLADSKKERSAELLNQWIKLFQQELSQYINNENQSYLNNLETLVSTRKAELNNSQERMQSFRKEEQYELLKQRLENNRNILTGTSDGNLGLESQIENLKTDIQAYTSTLQEIKIQINEMDQYITEESYISPEQIKIVREILPESSNLDELTITNKAANPLYQTLKEIENEKIQNLASSKSRLSSLKERKNNLEKIISSLEAKVASLENEYNNIKMNLNSVENNYNSVKEEYNKTLTLVNSKTYNINVINEAFIPEKPTSPNKKLNIAIAAVLGLMLAVFIIFFKEFMKEE